MSIIEAIILGIVQGLTEFLPVSSSGHIELGTALLGTQSEENLMFSIAVHAATALSTIVIFRKDIYQLIVGVLKFKWNQETQWSVKILISMIPVGVIGVLFEDQISALFSGRVILVGTMLLVTASLLAFTYLNKDHSKEISYLGAFIIGLAQSIAIMPGISRSGATIATALLLKVRREEAARFSFLMVLIPILGASLLKFKDYLENPALAENIAPVSLMAGFIAAFVAGLLACRWMINIVKSHKLIYFALYCLLVGLIAITSQLL